MFERISFANAHLAGSGFGGNGSTYSECNFTGADLSGSSGIQPTFRNCVFEATNFTDCLLKHCIFVGCKFVGEVKSVIFGPETGCVMRKCDFRCCCFVDCAFNNMRFESCEFSEDSILFADWPRALREFEKQSEQCGSSDVLPACRKWLDVWRESLAFTPQNIVDLADLKLHEGPKIAEEMFALFRCCTRLAS